MKIGWYIGRGVAVGGIVLAGISLGSAGTVKMGDTSETVIQELGKPKGRISAGAFEVYSYDRGKVELTSNLVTHIELISTEEVEERRIEQAKRQEEAEQRERETEQRERETRERQTVEGNRILSERLADTAFRAQSAGDQLDYWDLFRQRYPEVQIGAVYDAVYRQYQEEEKEARIREQLADLQQRTAAAEERAARAEQAARDTAYWAQPSYLYYYPSTYSYLDSCSRYPATHVSHHRDASSYVISKSRHNRSTYTITPAPYKFPPYKLPVAKPASPKPYPPKGPPSKYPKSNSYNSVPEIIDKAENGVEPRQHPIAP